MEGHDSNSRKKSMRQRKLSDVRNDDEISLTGSLSPKLRAKPGKDEASNSKSLQTRKSVRKVACPNASSTPANTKGVDTEDDEMDFKSTPQKQLSSTKKISKENETPGSGRRNRTDKFKKEEPKRVVLKSKNEESTLEDEDAGISPVLAIAIPDSLETSDIKRESVKRRLMDTPNTSLGASTPKKHSAGTSKPPRRNLSLISTDGDSFSMVATPETKGNLRRSERAKPVTDFALIFEAENGDDDSFTSEYQETGGSDSSDSEMPTPNKDTFRTPVKSLKLDRTITLTPIVTKLLEENGRKEFSPRRTPQINVVKNTPNSESYFTAETRIKFKSLESVRKADEAKKKRELTGNARKPRKGNRQGLEKSDKKVVEPNFSVTKEAARIDPEAELVSPWAEAHRDSLHQLQRKIADEFPRWLLLMRDGFNIMLHGYGSKQEIFEALSEFLEERYSIVIVNGLFTRFNPKKFLVEFLQTFDCNLKIPTGSSISFILEKLAETSGGLQKSPVFLFVMNFDVLAVRHPQMLPVICGLASLPFVYLVGSSDHINAGLGISSKDSIDLNLVWTDCTTYEHYMNELMWETNRFGYTTEGGNTATSLEHVLKSLTSNARRAFAILIGMQLRKSREKKSMKSFQGISFRELLQRCRDLYIAHSELSLKSLLTEFIDHKFVRYAGKSKHDENNLIVELDEALLEKYAEM